MYKWDLEIEAHNPEAVKVLDEFGLQPTTAAFLLGSIVPGLIAIEFNPHASDNMLAATIADIIERIQDAKPAVIDLADEAAWLVQRDERMQKDRLKDARKSENGSTRRPTAATVVA